MNRRVSRSRRAVLKSAAAALAAPWVVSSRVLGRDGTPGANDRVRVGVIGCGVRGKYLIANLPEAGQVVALCDCFLPRVASVREPRGEFTEPLARFASTDGRHCAVHQDYRRMLEREKLDAVVVATPDHHHAQAMILACQAGCDVYVEKPLAVTIAEGRAMVQAAKRYSRVVQVGSQQRTMEMNRFGCEFVRGGGIGKVSFVEVPNYPGPLRYEGSGEEPIPQGLDWDLFCGPTELRPHHTRLWVKEEFRVGDLLWRGWDLWRDYGGHLMTNWGAHSLDMVQDALGMDDSGPVEIWPEPERLNDTFDDRWLDKSPPLGTLRDAAADRMRFCPVTMRYANGVELRFDPRVIEAVFHGTKGKFFLSRNKYRAEPAELVTNPPDPRLKALWDGAGHVARPHLQNWLDCLRTRATPNAPIEAGHRSATVCHLANIARELGHRLRWNPATERFEDDTAANELLSRPRRAGFELPKIA